MDDLLAERVFARGLPVARLAAEWARVVGERLAAETVPATLEHGVLTVQATDGPWGAQARFLHEEIRAKANEALGSELVARVRVVVRPARGNPR
jgi:predicted nucleic acid-binding Zn ribbon protein